MQTPEQKARQKIDTLLQQAGWIVQSWDEMDVSAAQGVAVREYRLPVGYADYLLFVDRKAIGVVEAKKQGEPLSGVTAQSNLYAENLPPKLKTWLNPLPFRYQSTGIETNFFDNRDPDPRSRPLFAFHQPATLAAWAKEPFSLRARLRQLPPLVTSALWDAQIEAITNVEQSLAEDRPRALIQMATGSGKTFTAVNFVYRLIRYGGARRVLFLVDRGNLGRQANLEFQKFNTPDDGRKFGELYNVQHLQSNTIDPVARVCISTIQRLFSMLRGDAEFDPANEETSMFDMGGAIGTKPQEVQYNRLLPLEFFDVIVIDECHRSIYTLWRQVLEYFDAHLIGLTATPGKLTFGFFNKNLVMEYSRARAVLDRVNVDGEVYRIRTAITEGGSTIEAGQQILKRDRIDRSKRWETLEEELAYSATQLDRDVVTPDQIRTVIKTFREKLFTEIYPKRKDVPKTLVFAKDDNHAEEIVGIIREEFGKGDEFCRKITYRVHGGKAEELISEFRTKYNPRIAVTVDMIATGTDIKPLEILLFMRSVKSKVLYDQMLGRGTRVVNPTELQSVTPDAKIKDHFVIVDAVGITESPKFDPQTLERNKSVPLDKVLNAIAASVWDEDTLETLAGRLVRLAGKTTPAEADLIAQHSEGKSLSELATALIEAVNPDLSPAEAEAKQEAAVEPFLKPALRNAILSVQQRADMTIDVVSEDRLLEAGFNFDATERAKQTVSTFKQFLDENADTITALQILFSRPHRVQRLTFQQVKELATRLEQPPLSLTTDTLWDAFAHLEQHKVRGTSATRVLADVVALVRHAVQPDDDLIPYPEQVQARYQAWLAAQERGGRTFTVEQRAWLDRIADHIGVNLSIAPEDLRRTPFNQHGGAIALAKSFGTDWQTLLDDLNQALAA